MDNFFDKYFYLSNYRDGYNCLLEIEYFLKLEESLTEKLKTYEFKILFAYIENYEEKCTESNCYLKRFMKIKFKPENFENLKILLLQHAELLFKHAISKYPNDIKLRVGYIQYLLKKMKNKTKAKKEIISLNKIENNLECGFLIYKLKKSINNNNINDKDETIGLNNIDFENSELFLLKKHQKKLNQL